MASKGNDKPAETSAPKQAESASDAVRFDRDRLTGADAQAITGYPRHIVVGALADSSGSSFTAEQAKSACEKFLNREVEEA